MDTESNDDNFNDRFEKAAAILGDDQDDANINPDEVTDPTGVDNTEPPEKDAIGEDQEKPNDADKDKPPAKDAITPPVSWSSEDKAAFESLPDWSKELISRRSSEQEAFFGERSRVLAAREQEVTTLQTRAQQAQQQFASDLERATQLVQTLMPAKFSDIQSEADYIRVKLEDPQRAAEYEVFSTMLRNVGNQRSQLAQAQAQQKLDNEWSQLQTKFPEFKDDTKAKTILDEVRKTLVEAYGYTQEEVLTIPDHRHVQIVRDAIAWRRHQGALRAAEGKKVPRSPTAPTLRQVGTSSSANLNADQKTKILNRAGKVNDLREKAALLANVL